MVQKLTKFVFWVTFLGTPFWLIQTPSETSKSRPGGSQSPPRGSLDPPGATQKGAQTAQKWPEGNDTSPPGTQDASGGRLGDIWDPPGSILE